MAFDTSQGLIGGMNVVKGLIDQTERAQSYIGGMFDEAARKRAGSAIAAQDYKTAAAELGGRGMLPETSAAMAQGTRSEALQAYDQGDTAGASAAAARGGDAALYGSIQDNEAQDRKDKAVWMGNAADALLQIKTPEARISAFREQIIPTLKAMGVGDDQMSAMAKDGVITDEELIGIKTVMGGASAGLKIETTPDGTVIGIDPKTGKVSELYRGQQKGVVVDNSVVDPVSGKVIYQGQKTESLSPDETLVETRPAVAGGSSPAAGDLPRGIRNNNPGNIEDGEFAKSLPGYKGSDGRFAIFETPDQGASAQVALLQSYGKRGFDTPAEIINRWAPPTDGNDTKAYAAFVANELGVPVDEPLNLANPDTAKRVATAIGKFENGGQSASNTGGPKVLAKGASGIQTLTPDEVKVAGFLPGTVVQRKANGELDVVQAPNNGASPRKAEADLRKEFNARPEVKEYREVSNAYRNVQAAAATPSAAGDLSMIFAYMKILDPTSVVREQEFANAQNAAGVPDRIRNQYNKVLNGQRLNPNQRQDFISQAEGLYNNRKSRFEEISSEYRSYAGDYGIDPDRVVTAGAVTPAGAGSTRPAEKQTAAALATWRKTPRKGVQGAEGNPWVPSNEAEYIRLPRGAHYVDPDGNIKVKG